MHGNAVDMQALLAPDKPDAPSLPLLAPIIFRTALFQYMMQRFSESELLVLMYGKERLSDEERQNYSLWRMVIENNYKEQLMDFINPE